MEALIGAVIGGAIAIVGAYGVSTIQDRRVDLRSARDQRLAAAREVLAALQELNRRMVDVARIDSSDYDDRPWPELHAGTIRWNVARLSAALVAPQGEIQLLHEIDDELDRVMDQALTKHWQSRAFRTEREQLGALGAQYLNLVRANEGLERTGIRSIWPWASLE